MLVGIGIVLVVAGAIIGFAVDTAIDGVDLKAVGLIMIGGGVLSLLIAGIQAAGWMSMNNRKMRSERHMSPDGKHYVEESEMK